MCAVLLLGTAAVVPGCGSDTITGETPPGASDGLAEPFPESCGEVLAVPVCNGEGEVRCGNGVIDTCEICFSIDGSPIQCEEATEACDGAATETCQSLGYAGGEIECSERCTHEVRACDACLGTSQQVACATPRIDAFDVADVQLASDGSSIGAVWTSFHDQVYFARFDADLALRDYVPCTGLSGALGVDIVARAGGWWTAVGTGGPDGQITLEQRDAAGQVVASRIIDDATSPTLVPVPGAPPLLLYPRAALQMGQQILVAERLDADGNAAWTTEVGPAFLETVDAAYTGSGFLVTYRDEGAGDGTKLTTIDLGGNLGLVQDFGPAFDVELMAAGADRVAAVFRDEEAYRFHWLDGTGETTSELQLAPRDAVKATQEHAIVIAGDRALVALAREQDETVDVFHIAYDGSVAIEGYTLAREPSRISCLAGTSLDDRATFAWTTYIPLPEASRFTLGIVAP